MAQGDIETYYEDGQWKNKREGTDRAFGAGYSTKDEAAAAGREAAQADKVEHVIKNQDTVTATIPGMSRADCLATPLALRCPGDTRRAGSNELALLVLLGKGNLRIQPS